MTDSGPRKIGVSIEVKPHAYDPIRNPELFEGVLARRFIALPWSESALVVAECNCDRVGLGRLRDPATQHVVHTQRARLPISSGRSDSGSFSGDAMPPNSGRIMSASPNTSITGIFSLATSADQSYG